MGLIQELKHLGTISEDDQFAAHIRKWIPLSMLIGIIVGLAMSAFFLLTYFISVAFFQIPHIITMIIGGIIIWILVKVGFEDPSKNGISYVITKKHQHKPVPLKQTQEFVSAAVTVGTGLPVGREGPALIIGSAIASKLSEWSNIDEWNLHEAITIGSAAATGALFQAPFGSAVFATEVPYKEDSDEPMLMASFVASVISAITFSSFLALLGNIEYIVFDDPNIYHIGDALHAITILNTILIIIFGLLVGLFCRIVIELYYQYRVTLLPYFKGSSQILVGLFIGISSITIGWLFYTDIYLAKGIDPFDGLELLIQSEAHNILLILLLVLVIQVIATVAIIGAGFPGGIFGPSLAWGGLCGIIFANLLGITTIEIITAWAIIGMSASHAATTKTPIASILLVLEITGLPNLIIPLILANIMAYLVSGSRSLYQGQIRSREAVMLKELQEYDQFEQLYVNDLMTPLEKVIFVTPTLDLDEIQNLVYETEKNTFPVMDDEDNLVGIITDGDVINAINEGKHLVREGMTEEVITIEKSSTARQAMVKFLQEDVERLPVIDEEGKLAGIISMTDLFEGQRHMVDSKRV